jgi:hypothetical protein
MGLFDAIKNVFVKKSDHAEEHANDKKANTAEDAHAPSATSGLSRAVARPPPQQKLPPLSAESRRAHRGVLVRAFGRGPVDEAQKKQGARRVAGANSAKKAPKKEKYLPPHTEQRHHRAAYRHRTE